MLKPGDVVVLRCSDIDRKDQYIMLWDDINIDYVKFTDRDIAIVVRKGAVYPADEVEILFGTKSMLSKILH